ncbi:YihY/virulence factor BrkB family protein [Alteribacillus bidgolensis]|uniref:Membrane protein n=1 Tax=Alteribacillus bidgolensis TaxID=930129 RepID=A0A1G8JBT4_9BACI|nr:YihY/virulence factor BrkB family protein [Alteribacillus bidgolensis]SDI28646.1 membrane protein [Alteribacillus bidgolensis]
MKINRIFSFGRTLKKEMIDDRATGLAAEQAFYYMLALFPMMILFLSILPYLSMDGQRVMMVVETALPRDTTRMIEENVLSVVSDSNSGLLTFGIIGTIWSASTGMNAFIRAMNEAFNVENQRSFLNGRLLSILLTIGMIVTFLIIFALFIFGEVILNTVSNYVFMPDETESLLKVVRWILTVLVMITILCCLYYFAPNKKITFKHVLPGAITATIIWQVVSLGFSFYVNNFGNYSDMYGSLGGVIVLMLWLFLTGLALVIGGELNAILHKNRSAG